MGNLYEHLFATESTLKEVFFSDTSLTIIKISQNKQSFGSCSLFATVRYFRCLGTLLKHA